MDDDAAFLDILDNYDEAADAETETVRLRVCPIGQERSFFTGRCILEPRTGWKRNTLTNRLIKTYKSTTAAVPVVNNVLDPVVVED